MAKRATYPRRTKKTKIRWSRLGLLFFMVALTSYWFFGKQDHSTLVGQGSGNNTSEVQTGSSRLAIENVGDVVRGPTNAVADRTNPASGDKANTASSVSQRPASPRSTAAVSSQTSGATQHMPSAPASSDINSAGRGTQGSNNTVQGSSPKPNGTARTENIAELANEPDVIDSGRFKGPFPISGQDPFVEKSLEQVTAQLATNRFVGQHPTAWGENLPGITTHLSHVWEAQGVASSGAFDVATQVTSKPPKVGIKTVALTLDACGGKAGASFDLDLLEFLEKEQIPATIFVTSKWIRTNKDNFQRIAKNPLFEIAAHGTSHQPASINGRSAYGQTGTASLSALVKEVEGNVRDIQELTGRRPRWFRSGTAFYDEVAVAVIANLNLGIAGYSQTVDEGATLPARKVTAKTLAAKDGDILLAHINHPEAGTGKGLMQALSQMKEEGVQFVTLSPRK